MITDKEANIVYFSDKILDAKYLKDFNEIRLILDKHHVKYKFLKGTCRIYFITTIN